MILFIPQKLPFKFGSASLLAFHGIALNHVCVVGELKNGSKKTKFHH